MTAQENDAVAEERRRSFWRYLVPLLIVLVLLGYFLLRHRHHAEETLAPPPAAAPALPFLGTVQFEHDRSSLTPAGEQTLDQAANALRLDPTVHLRIEGLPPETGSVSHRERLEARRALAVEAYLAAQGIGRGQLTGSGFGPMDPEAAKRPGRADERRVELFVQ